MSQSGFGAISLGLTMPADYVVATRDSGTHSSSTNSS